MSTNKITLNELRTLIKNIIKESDYSDYLRTNYWSNDDEPYYDEVDINSEVHHDIAEKTGYNKKSDILGRELYQLELKMNVLFKEKALPIIIDLIKNLKIEAPKRIKDFNIEDKKIMLGYIYDDLGRYGYFIGKYESKDDFINQFLEHI